jgi:hypothetical protein
VTHSCNSSTREAKKEDCEFEDILDDTDMLPKNKNNECNKAVDDHCYGLDVVYV